MIGALLDTLRRPEITAEAIVAAAERGRKYVVPYYSNLLLATRDGDEPDERDSLLPIIAFLPRYRWNPAAHGGLGAFVDARGRLIPAVVIREQLDRVLDGISLEARALGDAYLNGDISDDDWYWEFLALIKSAHLVAAAMERGGWAQMTYADYAHVGRVVDGERGTYLDPFMEDLVDGTAVLGGAFLVRLSLYIQKGRTTYHDFADLAAAAVSALGTPLEEQRILDPGAVHCQCCIDEASKGPQPLGTLKQIGDCSCRSNCRCHKVYVTAGGKETKN